MKSLINYFIKYPISADILLLFLGIVGLMSLAQTTKSRFPEMESKTIVVETKMKGASPAEIESGITLKIENEIQDISDIKKITSQSQENFSMVTINATNDANMDRVLRDVKNAVDGINTFPTDTEKPIVKLREMKDMAAKILLSGSDDKRLLKNASENIKQDLILMQEIAEVSIAGTKDEEIEIAVNKEALKRYNLDISSVARTISNENIDYTIGSIKANGEKISIRTINKSYYAHELEDIIVKNTSSGTSIYLKDIANITEKWAEGSAEINYNGTSAIVIDVLTTGKQDISTAVEKVHEYVNEFNQKSDDLKLKLIDDGSVIVEQRTDMLIENALLGILLILLVLGFFLNIRIAFWVALSIPISALGMFILAPFFDVNINMFSLFGIILSVGILVDDGIVISENIYVKYESGISPLKAAWEGLKEVSFPVIIAITTTVAFFSVFFFLEGQIGDFVADVGFTVVVTLLVSLLEAFFILPAHIAHSKALKRNNKKNKLAVFSEKLINNVRDNWYAPALKFFLNNRMVSFAIFLVPFMLIIAFIANGRIPLTFFPYVDEDSQSIEISLPTGTTKDKTYEITSVIENSIIEVNKEFTSQRKDSLDVIRDYIIQVGPEEHNATITLYLLDGETRNLESFHIANAIEDKVGVLTETEEATYGNPSFFGAAISISLKGRDRDKLKNIASDIKDKLVTYSELKNVSDNDELSGKEFKLELTPEAKALGLSLQEISQQIRFNILGYEAQTLQRGNNEVDVIVRYNETDIDSYDDLLNMKIKINNTEYYARNIVSFVPTRSSLVIHHESGMPVITVMADQVDPYESTPEIQSKIEREFLNNIKKQNPDVAIEFGGQSEAAMETVGSAQKIIPLILLIAFFTIVLNFRSFKQALLVIILIPFSFIGATAGHLIHGMPISILSFYGIIAVAGIIINDSLVLVSRMNQLLQEGIPFKEAVFEAGKSRFRAILLTSITTIAGLAPLIFEKSLQAKLMVPMAISLAYGLFIATFITLLLLPVFISSLNSFSRWLHWLWEGEKITPEDVEPAVKELKNLTENSINHENH